jgi:hypothetical protein
MAEIGSFEAEFPENVKKTIKLSSQKATVGAWQTMPGPGQL